MADQVAVTETIINDLPISQRLLNDEVEQGYMGDILDEMREIKEFNSFTGKSMVCIILEMNPEV